jgi:hypothetical protein
VLAPNGAAVQVREARGAVLSCGGRGAGGEGKHMVVMCAQLCVLNDYAGMMGMMKMQCHRHSQCKRGWHLLE